ncbi:hypothetical protein Rs2_27676 [Raphanus sativus]|nr:hypothetical protein Rs2_27676 [Raphanus sativus]
MFLLLVLSVLSLGGESSRFSSSSSLSSASVSSGGNGDSLRVSPSSPRRFDWRLSLPRVLSLIGDCNLSGVSEKRPEGVKAAKARRAGKGKTIEDYKTMCELKMIDLEKKEKLSKLAILDTLLAKKEPLSEAEEVVKQKLLALI